MIPDQNTRPDCIPIHRVRGTNYIRVPRSSLLSLSPPSIQLFSRRRRIIIIGFMEAREEGLIIKSQVVSADVGVIHSCGISGFILYQLGWYCKYNNNISNNDCALEKDSWVIIIRIWGQTTLKGFAEWRRMILFLSRYVFCRGREKGSLNWIFKSMFYM